MRTLHLTNPLEHGADVLALQRLLNAKGFHVANDGVFGPATVTAVLRAKKKLGYHKDEIRPVAGPRLMKKLHDYQPPAPPKKPPETAASRMRRAIVAYCHWGIAHEPQIHYAQVRPMPLGHRHSLPMRTDCSGFATLAYCDAGAPDPNGLHYSGLGYTGTMLEHGRPVTKAQAKAGDLVIFGAFPGHHVCVVLEAGFDPLLASHGSERGPVAVRFSHEAKVQPAQFVFRNYLGDGG